MAKYQGYPDLRWIQRIITGSAHVSWVFSNHCREEMRADGLTDPDILSILKRGMIVAEEISRGELCYRVEGKTVDEVTATVIAKAEEFKQTNAARIVVITAWIN